MKQVEYADVFSLFKKTFEKINDNLIIHGNNVSFITLFMINKLNRYLDDDIAKICLAALLHDIGAYKKDDLSKILDFELEEKLSHKHSIYGYIFIKNFSPIAKYAEAVLHHHTSLEKLNKLNLDDDTLEITKIIHIADLADLCINKMPNTDLMTFLRCQTALDQNYVELLIDFDKDLILNQNFFTSSLYQSLLKKRPFKQRDVDKILEMIAYSIDFISPHTVNHTIITKSIAYELGVYFNLPKDELNNLEQAAIVHDIGKIAIPNDILESPNKLSTEEFEIMKQHVIYTEKILSKIAKPEIVKIATRHHEKLNGTGYPKQLSAKDLTTSDRILAIADIVSALIGKRSYKDEFDKSRVISILESEINKNTIDKEITEAFINNYDKFVEFATKKAHPFIEKYNQCYLNYRDVYETLNNL